MKYFYSFLFIFLTSLVFATPADIVEIPPENTDLQKQNTPTESDKKSAYLQKYVEALWLENKGQDEEALKVYQELNQENQKEPKILQELCKLGLKKNNKDIMKQCFTELPKIAPKDFNTFVFKAKFLEQEGSLKEAQKNYEEALKINSEDRIILLDYINLLSTLDSDKAIIYLQSLRKMDDINPAFIDLKIAEIYLSQKNVEKATNQVKSALKTNPLNKELHQALIQIYTATNNQQALFDEYKTMASLGLADADIYTHIGAYYTLIKDRENAKQAYIQAKVYDKTHPIASNLLALSYVEDNEYQKAIDALQESVNYSTSAELQARVSYYYALQKKHKEALEVLTNTVKQFPDNVEIRYLYALCLIDNGDKKIALKEFETIIKQTPKNEKYLLDYAILLHDLEKYSKMQDVLENIIEINPKNDTALNFLGYYFIDKKDSKNYWEEGRKLVERALVIKPKEISYIDSLAWYYFRIGNFEEAQKMIETLDESQDVEIALHKAEIARALKHCEDAYKYYNIVLEKAKENEFAQKGLKQLNKVCAKENL